MNAKQRRKMKRRGRRLFRTFAAQMQPLVELIESDPKRAATEFREAVKLLALEVAHP